MVLSTEKVKSLQIMLTENSISTHRFSNIFYTKQGKGNVLFLLHGFPENHTIWNGILPALRNHFTIITPDIPGAGKSILDNADTSMEELADAMKAIAEHENIQEMVIAGHSMGGYVSLAFAEKYPSLLKGISLIHSTATADDEERKNKRKKAIEIIRKGGKNLFIKEMIPALFSKKFRMEKQDVITRQIDRGMILADESIISFYNAMMNRKDKIATLKTSNFPIQMIIGKEETIAPMNILISQATLSEISFIHLYKDVLHMSMIEHSEQMANDLITFTNYCFNRAD